MLVGEQLVGGEDEGRVGGDERAQAGQRRRVGGRTDRRVGEREQRADAGGEDEGARRAGERVLPQDPPGRRASSGMARYGATLGTGSRSSSGSRIVRATSGAAISIALAAV